MIDSDIYCPGCGVLLTADNAGGYRCYCENCVEKIPELPVAPKGTGFVLQGKYPDFYWEEAEKDTPFYPLARAMFKAMNSYDEDIPQ